MVETLVDRLTWRSYIYSLTALLHFVQAFHNMMHVATSSLCGQKGLHAAHALTL